MTELISSIFVVVGVAFIFIGGLGILKLPDPLCRSHAISKALTFGITLMLIGLLFHLQGVIVSIKIFLAIFFLFLSMPLSGHIFALYASRQDKDS